MAPDQHVGVIVLGNRTGVSLSRTATRALELMVPLGPATTPERPMKPMTMTSGSLLPGTASPLPLLALLGILMIGAAVGLRTFRSH